MGKLKSFNQRLHLTTNWNTLLTVTIRGSSQDFQILKDNLRVFLNFIFDFIHS